ncbi:MAG: single-stranded DNA-binding protein [bacterium]|nr:single-stranded DNA-binding protein [bacterium]
MASFNRVILMGNLTKDPELRYTPSGLAVAHLSLAVNRKVSAKEGEKKEEVDFFDVETWDKQAELCSEYLNKGSAVLIEGRLKQDRWEDENGGKRSKIKIIATTIQFLPKRSGEEQGELHEGGDELPDSGSGFEGKNGAPF